MGRHLACTERMEACQEGRRFREGRDWNGTYSIPAVEK